MVCRAFVKLGARQTRAELQDPAAIFLCFTSTNEKTLHACVDVPVDAVVENSKLSLSSAERSFCINITLGIDPVCEPCAL